MKRYGPSRRRAQNASATLEISASHLKKSFATQSREDLTSQTEATLAHIDRPPFVWSNLRISIVNGCLSVIYQLRSPSFKGVILPYLLYG
jgi:hypothetical protein